MIHPFESGLPIAIESLLSHQKIESDRIEFKEGWNPYIRLRVKNVALMLFNESPERFFPYSYIDIVHFTGGPVDRTFTEKRCTGPMQAQIRQALDYLQSVVILEKVTKIRGQAARAPNSDTA